MKDLGQDFLRFARSLYNSAPLETEDLNEYRAREINRTDAAWLDTARMFAAQFQSDGLGKLELFAEIAGPLNLDSVSAEDIHEDLITLRLTKNEIPNEWCYFLTEKAFVASIANETFNTVPRAIWVASQFQAFATGAWTISPWNGSRNHIPPVEPFELPRKLVRDQTHNMTAARVDPWLVRGEMPEASSVFDSWRSVAAGQLAYMLPSEVRADGTKNWVIFKGPKATSADTTDTGWQSVLAFEALSDAVAWVYGTANEAETKFQFLNSHLALNWPAGQCWPAGVADVLPQSLQSARDSFNFHLQDVTKEALKTLGDLRKGLQEEVAKTQSATRDLVSSLWRDLGIAGIVLALKLPNSAQMSQNVLDWIIIATAIVLPLSLCVTGGTNWRFNRLSDAARIEWKPKLYGFVASSEWERIVEKPIRQGRRVYYWTLLFVALLYVIASGFLLSVAADLTLPLLRKAVPLMSLVQTASYSKKTAMALAVVVCLAAMWLTNRSRKTT